MPHFFMFEFLKCSIFLSDSEKGKMDISKMIPPVVLKMKNLKFREVQPTNCWPSDDKWELNFHETYLQVFRACRDQSFYYLIFFVWSKVLSNQYFCKEITKLRTVLHFQMIFMVFIRLATDLYIIYVWKHSNT